MFQKDQLSIGDWLLYFLLMIIPFVNLILFIVLLVNKDTNKTLKNMLLASLILGAIVFVLFLMMGAALVSMFEGFAPVALLM